MATCKELEERVEALETERKRDRCLHSMIKIDEHHDWYSLSGYIRAICCAECGKVLKSTRSSETYAEFYKYCSDMMLERAASYGDKYKSMHPMVKAVRWVAILEMAVRRCDHIDNLDPHNCPNHTNEYEGIRWCGSRTPLFKSEKGKRCLLVARAENMWQDYAAARELIKDYDYDIVAVNSAAIHLKEHVKHCISAHPELFPHIIGLRTTPYFNGKALNHPICHTDKVKEMPIETWEGIGNQVGTSGMLACLISICLGYERIILVGMPIDFSMRHYDDPPTGILPQYDLKPSAMATAVFMASWSYAVHKLPTFGTKIRSMSGLTSTLLGKPNKEWLGMRDPD